METHESLRDVENLRFRFQMNNRLRLECLAAMSKVFREFGEPIKDELLSSVVFALPKELISNGHGLAGVQLAGEKPDNPPTPPVHNDPPTSPKRPERPEREKPGLPPQSPEPRKPGLPPQPPKTEAPALPPQQPERSAAGYVV